MVFNVHLVRTLFVPNRLVIRGALACSLLASSAACAFMPSVGPHNDYIVEQVKKHKAPPLFDVDTKLAKKLADEVRVRSENFEKELLLSVNEPSPEVILSRIYPGDRVNLIIWTQGSGGVNSSETAMSPTLSKMGMYPVDAQGRIDIPYIGWVNVSGMTIHQAQQVVRSKLDETHQFEHVDVSLELALSHGQNIVVMGAVNKPTIINWNEGGISLIEAIAQAGGYMNSEPLHGTDLAMNVLLARKEREYNIPLQTALLHPIQLHPGDRIALQHKPNVRVLCLGAGWSAPRISPFAETPTLSQVMASVNGLNPQTAQGRSIFVMKKDQSVMYRINFDLVEGMEASQVMPVEDGDMVYVPVSRSVTMQQVLGMFMFIAGQGMSAASVR